MKKLFTLFLLCVSILAFSAEITGKVVSVSDGDTITVLDDLDKGKFRIRLFGIDAPEKNQDFGQVSKRFLSSLVFGKNVSVRFKETDRYGRLVGKIFLNGTEINLEILKAGLAWHYSYYDKSPEYANAEAEAKSKKIGLWQQPNPIPPWNFRRSKKK